MTARTSPPSRRCVVCGLLYPGELVALMPIGPGPDPEAREHARRGEPYTPRMVALCRGCAFGDDVEETRRETENREGIPPANQREPMK